MAQGLCAYETCCVESTGKLITDMVERAREIKIATFKRNCDWRPLAERLGYIQGSLPRLEDDYHVRFFKSRFDGRPCYYMVHSAIEYVFTRH